MKWKVSWSDVKKCIEKSGLKFITNASGYPLRDLAGRAIFTMKQGMGESLGLEFLSDLVLIDSWGKTNSSTPRALVEKVKTWYHNVPAKAPPGNLHLLQTQCTPTDVQVKSFYLPYLRWKASSPSEELKYTSLSSLHKEVWPIIQDRIFSDQVKPVVVGLDFVDVDNVACIVAHNNITINVSSSQLLHTSTAEESQYWDCIEE
uniref:Uncharacterized protein n=1 Tax=Mucochytrium quahogii TaxID=96639 RepID=A0A7S2SKK4_9STRA|mmetsp:Transcript_16132/g.26348  ORF Transcript_16132/g.26348 Transcript_16132/m.26348 type:complete len:203 (-) Transcript_16132:125-733(-)